MLTSGDWELCPKSYTHNVNNMLCFSPTYIIVGSAVKLLPQIPSISRLLEAYNYIGGTFSYLAYTITPTVHQATHFISSIDSVSGRSFILQH